MFPAVILFCIAVPSMWLLYTYDVEGREVLTIKVVGRQWYWVYQYSDFVGLEFDRYIKLVDDLSLGEFRLLEVDNRLVVPFGVNLRFVVTSGDVIHRWALPAVALKVDANPGYLNSLHIAFRFPGVYYGQCREICGANHRFIPVCVEVTSPLLFKEWVLLILR